jgi:hypothetical protein
MFFCGIARNQSDMLALFQGVFLLVIDEETQNARLEDPSDSTSPGRTEAAKQQIREGRLAFQAQMLARGAIPVDGTAAPTAVADNILAHLGICC